LEYWHNIPLGRELTEPEIGYLTDLVMLYVEERLPILTENGEKVPRYELYPAKKIHLQKMRGIKISMAINTEALSARYRAASVDLSSKRLLITNFRNTEQEKDLSEPPNCGGMWAYPTLPTQFWQGLVGHQTPYLSTQLARH
jgi:hypothetical protein